MSQTESDRFNAWWRSDERDIYPSKMHAWVTWLAATEAARERLEALEAENAKLADIIVEGQGVGALPHDGVAYGYMPKRIAELEAENARLAAPSELVSALAFLSNRLGHGYRVEEIFREARERGWEP